MRRVILLLVIILILLIAAFAIGLGWYLYIPQKINEVINSKDLDMPQVESAEKVLIVNDTEKDSEEVRLKLGERAAYRMEGYAEINMTLTNLDTSEGDARVRVTLYYSRDVVKSKVFIIEDIKPKERFMETFRVNVTEQWNSFDVEQV